MAKSYNVVKVEKDRGIITITIDDGRTVVINCIENTITGISKRKVKNIPSLEFPPYLSDYRILIGLNNLSEDIKTQKKCKLIETLWENLDLIDSLYNIPNIPKGYVNYCKENNCTIHYDSYKEFVANQKFKNCSPREKDFCKYVFKKFDLARYNITELYSYLYRIYNTTTKSKEYAEIFDLEYMMHEFIKLFVQLYNDSKNKIEFLNVIDTNKTFQKNIEIMDNYKNKERNEKILKNENKIRALENLEFDKYIIIVPSTMEEFTKEGKQQNNCVGYFYHNSIADNNNLIYFIRKKNNPKHSFVTCRYNIAQKETIEHRLVNNHWYDDNERIIERCDEFIKSIL